MSLEAASATALPRIAAAATRPWYFPMWVRGASPLQSPIAYSHPPATPAARNCLSTGMEPDAFQADAGGGGPAAHRYQDLIAGELTPVRHTRHHRAAGGAAGGGHAHAGHHGDALGLKRGTQLLPG